jgi:hypothetical protein
VSHPAPPGLPGGIAATIEEVSVIKEDVGVSQAWAEGDLDQLRFEAGAIDAELAPDPDAGFQRFCFELLRQHRSGLRRYQTEGRDGGIDLIEERQDGLGAVECKRIGTDGLQAARSRWNTVAKSLTAHLPTRSQSQYSPWWNGDEPIRKYTLCISSALPNHARVEDLRGDIKQLFRELGEAHGHLQHLRDIEVEVLHWPDLLAKLEDAPTLLFRWFPRSRPLGLIPVDRPVARGHFSSFLDSSHLDYYSRDRHIAEHGRPRNVQVEGEQDILNRLDEVLGLIITGAGGYGKTRLVQELGLLAQQQGWCVLRVAGPWRQQSLSRLAAMVGSSTRVLLLLDYIEMQQGFSDAVNDLLSLHETYGLHIRYVANCRSSFYTRVAHLPLHEEIPLAPEHGKDWFRDFRRSVVRHILETGGLAAKPQALEDVCREVPVLAVFLVYLSINGRAEDLNRLLGEKDFGRWVRRRLATSFQGTESQEVATMVAQFPMREETAHRLAPAKVLSTLEQDGWIEHLPADPDQPADREWSVVHDVVADQLLVSWLAEYASFASKEVEALLSSALEHGTLASVVASLQRIKDHPDVEDVPFSSLARAGFDLNPEGWISQVPHLLSSSLLAPPDAVALLESNKELWESQLSRWAVRQQIGWIAREFASEPDSQTATVAGEWLQRALDIEETDYLLRSGLLLAPAATAERAKAWINARPTDFSTHYVISAWLTSGLPPAPIAKSTLTWLGVHARNWRAWHVLSRWLGAGAEPLLIRDPLVRWLDANCTTQHGGYLVFCNWLKQGGPREVVDPYVVQWLEENVESVFGSYVLGAWLEVGADLDVALPFLERWMARDTHPGEDRFVYLSWLSLGGSVEVIQEHFEAWVDVHVGTGTVWYPMDLFVRSMPKTPELAAAMIGRWGVNLGLKGFGEVLGGWLMSEGDPQLLQPHLDEWLAKFGETLEAGSIYVGWLERDDVPTEIRAAAIRWFLAFPTEVHAGRLSKTLVYEGELEAEALRAILRWCATFPDHEDALWRLTQLKSNLHDPEVSEEVLVATEAVLKSALSDVALSDLKARQLTSLFTILAFARSLRTGREADVYDSLLLDYLRHPEAFQHGDVKLFNAERPGFVGRILALGLRGWLDIDSEIPVLERLLAWVGEWDQPYRAFAYRNLELAATHPLGAKLQQLVPAEPNDIEAVLRTVGNGVSSSSH